MSPAPRPTLEQAFRGEKPLGPVKGYENEIPASLVKDREQERSQEQAQDRAQTTNPRGISAPQAPRQDNGPKPRSSIASAFSAPQADTETAPAYGTRATNRHSRTPTGYIPPVENLSVEALEATPPAVGVVPAGTDKFKDERVRIGAANPDLAALHEEGWAHPEARNSMDDWLTEDTIKSGFNKGFNPLKRGEMINDINTRVGNLRKWAADSPFQEGDTARQMITLPNGNPMNDGKPWKGPLPGGEDQGDLSTYRELSDGTVISDEDLIDPTKVVPIDFGRGGYRLPGGRVVPASLLDPETMKFHHSQFPDGTVYMNADMSFSPEMLEARKDQEGVPWWSLGLGIEDPRAPWENDAGDFVFESDFWDKDRDNKRDNILDIAERSAINEVVPWAIDMNLNSAPYYIPGYNVASGLSAAMPYALGYAGDTYMPQGAGLTKLNTIGDGSYKDVDLSVAQRIGGTIAPPIEALVERYSGDTIGGIQKKIPKLAGTAFGKFLSENPIGQVISAAITEGGEELVTGPLNKLQQEGIRNYGREFTIDNATGQPVYDQNSPWGGTLAEDQMKNFLAGASLGGGMASINLPHSMMNYRRANSDVIPDAPVLQREGQMTLDEELERLDRQYGEDGKR